MFTINLDFFPGRRYFIADREYAIGHVVVFSNKTAVVGRSEVKSVRPGDVIRFRYEHGLPVAYLHTNVAAS